MTSFEDTQSTRHVSVHSMLNNTFGLHFVHKSNSFFPILPPVLSRGISTWRTCHGALSGSPLPFAWHCSCMQHWNTPAHQWLQLRQMVSLPQNQSDGWWCLVLWMCACSSVCATLVYWLQETSKALVAFCKSWLPGNQSYFWWEWSQAHGEDNSASTLSKGSSTKVECATGNTSMSSIGAKNFHSSVRFKLAKKAVNNFALGITRSTLEWRSLWSILKDKWQRKVPEEWGLTMGGCETISLTSRRSRSLHMNIICKHTTLWKKKINLMLDCAEMMALQRPKETGPMAWY